MPSYREIIEAKISSKKGHLAKIEADLNALERTLKILDTEKADNQQQTFAPSGIVEVIEHIQNTMAAKKKSPSIPMACHEVLRQAGKPLKLQEIIPLIRAKGCNAAVPSVRGTLYGLVKRKKMFKLVRPGVFALIDWKIIEDPFEEEDHIYENAEDLI